MLPRCSVRGGLFMMRITRRKTPDEKGAIGVPALTAATGAARPASEAFG
jgi:hypothetical protein